MSDLAYYSVSLVSGVISSDSTWQKSLSPYLVTGDVEVSAGVTLTIEPGVEVRFTGISDDRSSGQDLNRSELRIRGVLNAVGTVGDSILFTSNEEVPASGDWWGIYVYDSGSRATIEYSKFEYKVFGV